MTIAVIVGTRPEAIKVAPLINELRDRGWDVDIVSTGQHKAVLREALALFGLSPTTVLDVFNHGQSLAQLASRVLREVGAYMEAARPSMLIVQGDTNSAAAAGIAGAYAKVPVVHLEAGLRTGDRNNPFPEELNRTLLSACAELHLAPTARAMGNLLREGVDRGSVVVTGNTVIDALYYVSNRVEPNLPESVGAFLALGLRPVLVTTHRRESWGEAMLGTVRAVRSVISELPDTQVLLPVHPNPAVRATVQEALGPPDQRVMLCEPLSYSAFVHTLAASYVVVTDSGGVQEEAPSFGKPVLVLRETTERPEGIEAGVARIVGTDPSAVRRELHCLLTDDDAYARMACVASPYGDGQAASRAADAVEWRLGARSAPPTEFGSADISAGVP